MIREIFWLENDRICGRCGPVEVPWSEGELKENRIDAILTLGEGLCDSREISAVGIQHCLIPLPDTIPPTPKDEALCKALLPKGLVFICKERKENHTILIHCHAGTDRTCLMMAYFLVLTYGISTDKAIAKIRNVRPNAFVSPGWEEMSRRIIDAIAHQ